MMNRCLYCAFALLACVAVQGASAAQPALDQGVPALKIVAPNGQTSMMIGGIHVGVDDLRQPDLSKIPKPKALIVESTPAADWHSAMEERDAEVRAGRATRAPWASTLTDAQVEELRQNARCNGLSWTADQALSFKRSIAAYYIAISHCARAPVLSRDLYLLLWAIRLNVPSLEGLESPQETDKQRLAVPERIYRYHLLQAFTPESRVALREAAEAIGTGKYDAIVAILRRNSESPADADLYYKLLVADRNRAWMPRLMRHLDEGNAFVNVGAGHLGGPEGLIALLRASGYTVEPIMLPAGGPR